MDQKNGTVYWEWTWGVLGLISQQHKFNATCCKKCCLSFKIPSFRSKLQNYKMNMLCKPYTNQWSIYYVTNGPHTKAVDASLPPTCIHTEGPLVWSGFLWGRDFNNIRAFVTRVTAVVKVKTTVNTKEKQTVRQQIHVSVRHGRGVFAV